MAGRERSTGYINVKIEEIRNEIQKIAREKGMTMTEACGYAGLASGMLSSCREVYHNYAKKRGLPEDRTIGRIRPIDHARLNQILGGDIDKYTILEDLPKQEQKPEPETQEATEIQLETYKLLKELVYYTKQIAEALQ